MQPYPALDAQWAVSVDGGTDPLWSPDGSKLYFRRGQQVLVVDLKTKPAFAAGQPHVLFEAPYWHDLYGDQSWDIAPDGKHCATIRVDPEAQPQLRVVTGWGAELERLLPRR